MDNKEGRRVVPPPLPPDEELRQLQLKTYRFVSGGPLAKLGIAVLAIAAVIFAMAISIYTCNQDAERARMQWEKEQGYHRHDHDRDAW